MCKEIWGLKEGERILISLNQYSQPVGKNSSKLALFWGGFSTKNNLCTYIV
ncbi:hypothetical protein LINGRAHAP2_LOCUS23992 [Linum grandiflorum]